jgi:5,10-methylenetetrahydrofolate reductase
MNMSQIDCNETTDFSQLNLVERLRRPGSVATIELRPPGKDIVESSDINRLATINHSMQDLVTNDVFVFLTDQAVGLSEEESLSYLEANMGSEIPISRFIPFLTCKHTLEYCLNFADRAHSLGCKSIVVLGGDKSVGLSRCVPHSYLLREQIQKRQPKLSLGNWVNPHKNLLKQIDYLTSEDFLADFYLTQIVSHHSVDLVAEFLEECDKRNVRIPGLFGVFYYWNAKPVTLKRLNNFLPVPIDKLTREFDVGDTPEAVVVRTIRALKAVGAENIYLSNLGYKRVHDRLEKILQQSSV